MMWSKSVRNWFGVFVFITFLGGYTNGVAGQFVINTVSPVEGGKVSREFIIIARIIDDEYPFTEAGEQRWVEAKVRNNFNQTIALLPLRDHGQGTDKKRGDGEWSAPAALHLTEGQYRLIITVHRRGERYSRTVQFIVSPDANRAKTYTGTTGTADPAQLESRIKALAKDFRTLEDNLGKAFGSVGLYIILAVMIGLAGIQIFLLLRQFWIKSSNDDHIKQVRGELKEENTDQPPAGVSEKWRPLFGGIESIQKAATGISRDLSSTFQANQQLKDQAMLVAEELIGLYRSVDASNNPATQALKLHLKSILKKARVEIWTPSIGEPVPQGCEQRPDPKSTERPGTVSAVLQPGFRINQDNEMVVLVKPVASVAVSEKEGTNL